jgi:glycerol kinase
MPWKPSCKDAQRPPSDLHGQKSFCFFFFRKRRVFFRERKTMKDFIGALDQGTTSTRFIVFDRTGNIVSVAQKEHAQHTPHPGWLEHDPAEILRNTRETAAEALIRANIRAHDLAGVGITNQRETTVLWDRRSGAALHPAIVWQDTRVDAAVASLARGGHADAVRARTGLPLASYFSALKLQWLLDHVPEARAKAEAGDALFGTIDCWLAWNLTGQHLTDVTNASRTQLLDLATLEWSPDLLALFGIPRACLPAITSSSAVLGEAGLELDGVPLGGMLGDQQAALVGQVCFSAGEAKNTYGTGNFLLLNTGAERKASQSGLITTVAYRFGEEPASYALEGSIANTGALIQWLRDNLGMIRTAAEADVLAAAAEDNGGVYIVPAFSGLYAPHWRADARGLIAGLTRYADRRHICRAALEAAAYQTHDVAEAMEKDSGIRLATLRVDGGMVRSEPLMQFQADILGTEVVRPAITETTALGAAYAAGLATGFWSGRDELRDQWRADRRWRPGMDARARAAHLAGWRKAVERSLGWLA